MAKRSSEVRTADLLKAAGGISQPTLYRWIGLGIMPEAERRVSGGGDGVRARWPQGALERARWVAQRRAEGLALDEIAELVKAGQAPPVGAPPPKPEGS